jgi:hypothetical protein
MLESVIAELLDHKIFLHTAEGVQEISCSAEVYCAGGKYPRFAAGLTNGNILIHTTEGYQEILLLPELAGHKITTVYLGEHLWAGEKEGSLIKYRDLKPLSHIVTKSRFKPLGEPTQNDYFTAAYEENGTLYAGTAIGKMYILKSDTLQPLDSTLVVAARGIDTIKSDDTHVYFVGRAPNRVTKGNGRPEDINTELMTDLAPLNERIYMVKNGSLYCLNDNKQSEMIISNKALVSVDTITWNGNKALLMRNTEQETIIMDPRTKEIKPYKHFNGKIVLL